MLKVAKYALIQLLMWEQRSDEFQGGGTIYDLKIGMNFPGRNQGHW